MPRARSRILLSFCLAFLSACSADSASVRSGKAAPEFRLTALDGSEVRLSDLRGKAVLIDFWATWCPPCRMSTPAVVQLAAKYRGKPVAVVGISLDEDHSEVPPYVKKAGIKHLILYGAESDVSADYGVSAIPAFFVLGKDGSVLKKYSGYYPGMERDWELQIESALAK